MNELPTMQARVPIERYEMDDSKNAQALTPTLSRGERVRTAELAVANSVKLDGPTRGFTLLEMIIALAVLSVLLTMAAPVLKLQAQRSKEADLRQALRDIRSALDAYKQAAVQGRILVSADESGYPPSLEVLVAGVPDAKDPKGTSKIYFLRRLPRDPFNDEADQPAAGTWAQRSYASPPDAPQAGEDVFDVASKSPGVGLNGVPYAKW
jgi:general secretion pathway protein G